MKPKISMITGYLVLAGVLSFSFYGIGQTLASSNYEDIEQESDHDGDDDDYRHASANQNPLYVEECGSCHMAYPAQLLPRASWEKIIAGLEHHFGENAELDATSRREIEDYLVETSASSTNRKLFRNLGDQVPLRIIELPYFVRKHDEIPSRYVKGNDKVGSFSQCNACHQKAERGRFDEDDVVIPGFGRWDD